jgi:ankyrin repeat protein
LIAIHGAAAHAESPRDHALFAAIRNGDRPALVSHLREGAPVNVRAHDGTTPLMLAAVYGAPETVRLLLEAGANPNAVSNGGASPLLLAAGNLEKIRLLVDHGADVNARSSTGNTPLVAAAAHPDNLDAVQFLLEKGANLDSVNNNNVSALAAAVYSGDPSSVKFLLDRGCKPTQIRNLFGAAENSPLVVAAQMGEAEIVDLLLAHGADVNAVDANFAGHALNYALLAQKPDIARRLIEAGADLKQASPIGMTPPVVLATYSETGDLSVAKLMLERGADMKTATQTGETALTWARRRGNAELIALLSSAGTPDPTDPRPTPPAREIPTDAHDRAAHVRSAVEKSLAVMQHSSDVFLEKRRTCVSCHHQNLQSVALGWARDRGFALDDGSVQRIISRQIDTWSRRVDAAYEMDRPMPAPAQLLGYGLWGLSALGYAGDSVTDAYVWYLAAIQKPDGHWTAGAITRPPMGGSEIMSSVLAMRALQLYAPPAMREEIHARVERTALWLASSRPATHQDLAHKIMGLAWSGAPQSVLSDDVARLVALQRADGGWAQLPNLDSDAWATGQSLVALRLIGRSAATAAAAKRGVDFLLRTQFEDGSWYVQSRSWPFQPPFDSEFPFGRDQWISAGGTAWATMALVLEVEPKGPVVVPSRTDTGPNLFAAGSDAKATNTTATPAPGGAKSRTEPVDFVREIKPVIERSCAGCHSGEKPEGGFLVTQRAALVRGGESGDAAVTPGRSATSPIMVRVSGEDPDLAMPPPKNRDKFVPLSADEVATLRAWIDQGADWPDEVKIEVKAY